MRRFKIDVGVDGNSQCTKDDLISEWLSLENWLYKFLQNNRMSIFVNISVYNTHITWPAQEIDLHIICWVGIFTASKSFRSINSEDCNSLL